MTTFCNGLVEYVPNNTFKPEHGSLRNPNHDGYDLLCEGFILRRHRVNEKSSTINWLCKHRHNNIACPGSVTIDPNGKIIRRVAHKIVTKADATEDSPRHLPLTEVERRALDFKHRVKLRCSLEDSATVQKICQEEKSKLLSTASHLNHELVAVLPDFHSMRSSLYKRKQMSRMTSIPHSISDVVLEEEVTETITHTKFLRIDSKDNTTHILSCKAQRSCLLIIIVFSLLTFVTYLFYVS